jgi:chemotaxis family two-component system response regulator Rcp1
MTNPSLLRPVEILLVEDSPGDVRLTQEVLREGQVLNHLNVVEDGAEAIAYLHQEPPYTSVPVPDLILLDLNLPKKDGREVLSIIKKDQLLRRIPVIVLTTSRAEEDILRAYDLHANCYITKPIGLDQFVDVVRSIEAFWLSIVKLPPE